MKKFFIVLLFVIILAAFLPLLTGYSYLEIYEMAKDKIEGYNKEPYFNDIELEVMQDRNSTDNGTIKAYEALEIGKETYASSFSKVYFSDEEDVYIYKMPDQNMYMAVYDIVVLDNRDFYELILFELDSNNQKNILVRYYVDSLNGEIYDEKNKPQETKEILDYGLGFKFAIPVTYKEYIKMDYLPEVITQAEGKDIKVKPVQCNYVFEDKTNLLFTLLLFEGTYDKEYFTSSLDDTTFYVGANSVYTYLVVRTTDETDYFPKAKDLLRDDFLYILRNIEIYN